MSNEANQDGTDLPPTVAFDYIKGQFFRVIHADGAIGGATPNGGLHLAFFSERPAIPQREVRLLNEDGSLGQALAHETKIRDSVVREIDVDVMISLPTAEALRAWLSERIEEMKKHVAQSNTGRGGYHEG